MEQHLQILSGHPLFRVGLLLALPPVGLTTALFAQTNASLTPPAATAPSSSSSGVAAQAEPSFLDSRLRPAPRYFPLATLALDRSRVATVTDEGLSVSTDEGKTFAKAVPLLPGDPTKEGRPRGGPIIRTTKGTLVLVYGDPTTRKLSWDRKTGEPKSDMRADVWAIRSTDGGRTWSDRQEISALFHHLSPYCLSLIQLTQAMDGTLVVPLQLRVGNSNRSVLTAVISHDEGKTWQPSSSVLDNGGSGVHDGLLEPTLVPLRDGRLWMLIRTNLDKLYETFSGDSGLTWSSPMPTSFDASSSPAYLLRLQSGRLMLLWNRLYPSGQAPAPRRSGKGYSQRPASWHRDELSLAFSEDDGRTWSVPTVIVRRQGAAAYPSAIERRPGEIWLSVSHPEKHSFQFYEADFVAPVHAVR